MFVIPAPLQASVAVAGTADRFPVRRIFCVGRNYAAHAREMGKDPDREPPFFFTKPADAVVDSGVTIPYPVGTNDLHHEIELVVALGKPGSDVPVDEATSLIWGAGVGIDLTRRDLQAEAKNLARPWDLAKGFDRSAPIAPLTPLADVPSLTAGRISLAVNGTVRQEGDLSEMIWPVADTIAYLSKFIALAPGDLIMTGTPSGVAAVGPGDVMIGEVEGLTPLEPPLGPRQS